MRGALRYEAIDKAKVRSRIAMCEDNAKTFLRHI